MTFWAVSAPSPWRPQALSCPSAAALTAWVAVRLCGKTGEIESPDISAALGPEEKDGQSRLAGWTDPSPESQPAAKQGGRPQAAGQMATGVGRQGHQDVLPPPAVPPTPAAHQPGREHRFISQCGHNPTIGFLITDSNVRRINILTN